MPDKQAPVVNGDSCRTRTEFHKEEAGFVEDLNCSRSGILTITLHQDDGKRLKNLYRKLEKI